VEISGPKCSILLIGGSLRSGSVNAAVLATANALAPTGTRAIIYTGMGQLPHFNPDDDRDPLPSAVSDLRRQLDAADAVLFSTPEYAGSLPGSFKNLLDWTVGGGIQDKPVGWINASAHGGAQSAHETLRVVLGFVDSDLVAEACVQVAVPRDAITSSGLIERATIREAILGAMNALIRRVAERGVA
jgi:chromate reductase, NAD(P)H dehydrogenase (quinone)